MKVAKSDECLVSFSCPVVIITIVAMSGAVQVPPVLLIVPRQQGYAGMCGSDSLYKFPPFF